MITILISAILLAITIPSFTVFLKTVRLNSLSATIVSSLQEGRSEAIKRNARVLVCASDSAGAACRRDADWGSEGWIVCYDNDADNTCDPTADTMPNPIRREKAVNNGIARITGPVSPIGFNPTGSQGAVGSTPLTITIVAGAERGAPSRSITMAATGLIKGTRTN